MFTETGYHNALSDSANQPPASEAAAAVYFPRLLLTPSASGPAHVHLRAARREARTGPGRPQQHFGLLRNDFSPKPAFTAMRTPDRGGEAVSRAGDRHMLDWTVSGAGAKRSIRLTLVRRDGSRVLALWRPVSVWDRTRAGRTSPGEVPVTIAVRARGTRPQVWRPSSPRAPVESRSSARRLPVRLAATWSW